MDYGEDSIGDLYGVPFGEVAYLIVGPRDPMTLRREAASQYERHLAKFDELLDDLDTQEA